MEISSVPISSCSKEHQKIYREWFQFADSDSDGRITGSDAIKFFSMSNLSRQDLKQVWAITDSKRQGFLGFTEFVAAMQLVSLAQAGNEITNDLLTRNADLENLKPPVMEGLDVLLAKKKRSNKTNENEVNGNPVVQQSPSALWFSSKSSKKVPLSAVTSIVDGLKRLYVQKLKPLEVTYKFNDFVSPLLTNSDFDAKPMVMLLGQYSTGKTTFIKHLLKTSYPGAHIGPEPTTDRFVVVMSGSDERSVPGNTIAVQADMPFSGLTSFGTAFLSKFECSQMPHPLLEHITFVDTPGVLSGEKQRTQRAYNFTGVTSWFASKCDLILLLFDPHKLDVSDEFKRVISSLRGHDDKIRVVLNKADQIDTQQLMRVYGALMWSLGKVLNTPEVMRVYIGSFNDKPVNEAASGPIGKELFEREQEDLLADLKDIPKKSCDRRINEFVKRARAAKIHAYIISHLRKEMPALIGKAKTQQKLTDNLEDEFKKVQREFHLPPGDFPNVEQFRETLSGYSFDNFEKLKPSMIKAVDDMLGYDIPELLKNFRNPYD
ncbi:PREDICTED: EH domain-containing protein 1 isoform X1 [Fragaria vesca subsp. vesca]|uniref:EH domain-containing protein 1 isoform X1 n=1 Tax=Fragaria vesca subsp. vesca TaxID=101020 RepID=UPI0002C33491|nr:PREDICTED: EH domain-containing protein 1 isoform X1 [Fragaria vesca subsp. vesca]